MKIFESAELHPPLSNEHRTEVYEWCAENIIDDEDDDAFGTYKWGTSSTYDDHGDFKVVVRGHKNEPFVTAFLLKFPDTICNAKYRYELGPADEALALFEGLEP